MTRKFLKSFCFWWSNFSTTGMGETASGFSCSQHGTWNYGRSWCNRVAHCACLTQFAVRNILPWVYWLAVSMVAVPAQWQPMWFTVGLGVPYIVSSTGFTIARDGTTADGLGLFFDPQHYTTKRREFYWATVLATLRRCTAAEVIWQRRHWN